MKNDKERAKSNKTVWIAGIAFLLCMLTFGVGNFVSPSMNELGVDSSLNWTLRPNYDTILEFCEGKAYVKKNNHGQFYESETGLREIDPVKDEKYLKEMMRPIYNDADSDSERLYGMENLMGNIVIPIVYKRITGFSEGRVFAETANAVPWGYEGSGKYVMLDENGKTITKLKGNFEELYALSDGKALFKQGGLYGYLDKEGEAAIQPQFAAAKSFMNGRAASPSLSREPYRPPWLNSAFPSESA